MVGADRIAANGDAVNKIGTFGVAIMAHRFGIPFYVAAPVYTIDPETPTGDDVPIEDRDPREVTHIGDHRIPPEGVEVYNLAFDPTPNELITGIITEKGVLYRALCRGHPQAFSRNDTSLRGDCVCPGAGPPRRSGSFHGRGFVPFPVKYMGNTGPLGGGQRPVI